MSASDSRQPSDAPPGPSANRRTDERHFACFPAHVKRPGGSTRMALIRDLSVSGALLFTRERLTVGNAVELHLYIAEDMEQVRRVTARVVRVQPRSGDRAEVWLYATAVQFDEVLVDCEAEIEQLEAHQAALGVPRD